MSSTCAHCLTICGNDKKLQKHIIASHGVAFLPSHLALGRSLQPLSLLAVPVPNSSACPKCGKTDFPTSRHRGQHARWCKGAITPAPVPASVVLPTQAILKVPIPPAKPVDLSITRAPGIPLPGETFLSYHPEAQQRRPEDELLVLVKEMVGCANELLRAIIRLEEPLTAVITKLQDRNIA
jgi:hypothetical protein